MNRRAKRAGADSRRSTHRTPERAIPALLGCNFHSEARPFRVAAFIPWMKDGRRGVRLVSFTVT